ncbi:MAG: hypothetical protein ACOYOS_12920 [Syntrophales bacterium]
MKNPISTEEELGFALKNSADTIVIEGDLVRKVIRIRATGKTAWIIAAGAIAVAITMTVVSGGTSAPASFLIGSSAIGILGLPTAIAAVLIGLAAGGIAALNRLRGYKEITRSEGRVVLKKK